METGQQPLFPAEPIVNPQMEHLDQWRARSKIPIPMELLSVIKHRMLSYTPELVTECPNDEWMQTTLGEALVFRSETGSLGDLQMSLVALFLRREMYPPLARAGKVSTPIAMGDQMVCLDYSSQPVTLGELSRISIDFRESHHRRQVAMHYLMERRLNVTNVSCYTSQPHMGGRYRGVPGDPFIPPSTYRGNETPAIRVSATL